MSYRVLWGALALLIAVAPGEAATLSDFDKAILDAQNRERAGLGVPPRTWSDTLSADAAQWADHLVKLTAVRFNFFPQKA